MLSSQETNNSWNENWFFFSEEIKFSSGDEESNG